jgi:hypothetical protein
LRIKTGVSAGTSAMKKLKIVFRLRALRRSAFCLTKRT